MLIQCGVNTQHRARLLTADPNHEMVRGSWCWTLTRPAITHRCRYSGAFSCQPVRWFPPAQVLQYANMLAACDGCSAVCRLQVRNAMLQLGRWIIIIIGSGLFSHQACILQLRHSAHCSAATLSSGHPIHYYPFHIKTIPIKSLFWETSKISMFK